MPSSQQVQMPETRVLYTRYRDGSVPVTVTKKTQGDSSNPKLVFQAKGNTYTTARDLLKDLTGGENWSFNRYFQQGKYKPLSVRRDQSFLKDTPKVLGLGDMGREALGLEPQQSTQERFPILEMFMAPVQDTPQSFKQGLMAPNLLTLNAGSGDRAKFPRLDVSYRNRAPDTQGIDLARRGIEVQKLLLAGYGRKIYAMGYDADDVLQEVYKGLLVRNMGTCAWNPAKSSFGHYVHMVCGCILSNYHRKMSRMRSMEQTGIVCGDGEGSYGVVDVAEAAGRMAFMDSPFLPGSSVQSHDATMLRDFVQHLQEQDERDALEDTAMRVLPLVMMGYERGEIAITLEVSKTTVSRALVFLRKAAGQWALSPFLT